ncbi:hypothetical protein AB6F62_11165 [Providencia huaxiensis]
MMGFFTALAITATAGGAFQARRAAPATAINKTPAIPGNKSCQWC